MDHWIRDSKPYRLDRQSDDQSEHGPWSKSGHDMQKIELFLVIQ